MAEVQFKTQEEIAAEQLANWRESTKVSALQARVALSQAGYLDSIETLLTDTTDALIWNSATEFRRNSPLLLEFATALDITDDELDSLFKFAATVEV